MKAKFLLALTLSAFMSVTANAAMAPLSPEFLKWQEELNSSVRASGAASNTRNYGVRPSPLNLTHLASNPVRATIDIPESFDLRNWDVVPPIRNQALWGTCWTFATMGAVETNYLLQLRNGTMTAVPEIGSIPSEVDLSELFVDWFAFMADRLDYRFTNSSATNVRTPTGYSAIEEGGFSDNPVATMARGYGWGPVSEKEMPYLSAFISEKEVFDVVGDRRQGETREQYQARLKAEIERRTEPWCRENLYGKKHSDYTSLLRLKDAAYMVFMAGNINNDTYYMFEKDTDGIKQLIMEQGGLYLSYYSGGSVSNDSYYYKGTEDLHAVCLIGWDDNYAVENFVLSDDYGNAIPTKPGAWLIRNSWGENATGTNGGYFWMSYEQPSLGSGTAFTMAPADSSLTTYTHSALGWCSSWGNEGANNPFYGASVFKVGANDVALKELGFYTTDNGSSVEFSIYKYGTTKPTEKTLTSGQPVATEASQKIAYAGFHTIELSSPVSVNSGEYFAVVLRASNPSWGYPLAVMTKINNWSDFAKFYDGEGYVSSNGTEWIDGITMTDSRDNPAPITPAIYVYVTGAAAGDEGRDTDDLTIDGLPIEDLDRVASEINVDYETNETLNPNIIPNRIFDLTLGGVDGKAVADNKDFTVYLMYTNDLLHWDNDNPASKMGVRYPSGDIMPIYPKGYKPDLFLTYSIEDDFGNSLNVDLPAYGPFEKVTSGGGRVRIDVDDLRYADLRDIERAGERANIPTGYHDLYYFSPEDTATAASGIVENLEVTVNRIGDGGSSSGCNFGFGAAMFALIGVFFKKR